LPKIKKLTPKQYYICCSKELTPNKIEEIYDIFSDYMTDDTCIITLLEIENFLNKPDNVDILTKHLKLWMPSTNILHKMCTNDISIDSAVLFNNIKENEKLFVQTSAYDAALKCLEDGHTLFLVGNPGVGKTITSQMLILYYISNGYKLKCTTNGENLSDLKKSTFIRWEIKRNYIIR